MVKKLLELIENRNSIKIYYKTFNFKQTLSKKKIVFIVLKLKYFNNKTYTYFACCYMTIFKLG